MQERTSSRLGLGIVGAVGAGAVSVLTLPPFSLLVLVPVAWSGLFICLAGRSPRRAIVEGFAFGLGQFGPGLSRIAESFTLDAARFDDRVRTDGAPRYFNTVRAYDGRDGILTGYAKHHLVPFGEYMPLPG
ncbi:MAG: hypothetical protein U5K36_05250 [Roseovarius sp.]|nr:hypothetical protein [Roseovarius sp.]